MHSCSATEKIAVFTVIFSVARQLMYAFLGMLPLFLYRLQSMAAHRVHFVRRLSVNLSVCPVVMLSW